MRELLLLHEQDGTPYFLSRPDERRAGHLAHDLFAAAVDGTDDQLGRLAAVTERTANAGAQLLDRKANVEVQEVLPLRLVAAQPPHVLRPVVPGDDTQLAIDDDDAAADAGQD